MEISSILKYAIDAPLERIASKESSLLAKAISALAIVIFTALSLGYYAVYAYRSIKAMNITNAQHELYSAVEHNDFASVKTILQKYPNLMKTTTNHPILHMAVAQKNEGMVTLIIKSGANLETMPRGLTPLEIACGAVTKNPETLNSESLEMVKLLLKHGAKIEGDNLTNSPLCSATEHFLVDIIKYLLNEGANPNNPTLYGSSKCLVNIANQWNTNPEQAKELIQIMIKKGAKIEGKYPSICDEAMNFIQQTTASLPKQSTSVER